MNGRFISTKFYSIKLSFQFRLIAFIVLCTFGCASKKNSISTNINERDILHADPIYRQPSELEKEATKRFFAYMDSVFTIKHTFFSCKVNVQYATTDIIDSTKNESRNNIKTSLKIHSDTAIHTLLSVMGIPVFTAKITPDSVLLLNQRQKCFSNKKLDIFLHEFGLPFSYNNLQSLLLGQAIFINDSTFFVSEMIRKENELFYKLINQRSEEWTVVYVLSKDGQRILRFYFTQGDQQFTVHYDKYTDLPINDTQTVSIPQKIEINIFTPTKNISLSLSYDKMQFNLPKDMRVIIPNSYETCPSDI